MHEALKDLQNHLEDLIEGLQSNIPNDEPFGTAHNDWSFPAVSRAELTEEVQSVIDLIEDHETDDLGDFETRIRDYGRRLDHLHTQTIPNIWGNAGQAVAAFQITMDGLRKALSPLSDQDGIAESRRRLRVVRRQLRGMEADLNGLEPRTETLVEMVGRIEQAHSAADQLPTDLESLSEARKAVGKLVREVTRDRDRVSEIRGRGEQVEAVLSKSATEAKAVLVRCETAYSAATSVGLAAAFSERSRELANSMWFWIVGLVAALGAGSYLGLDQLRALSEIFSAPEASGSVIVLNVLLSILSVGAPVWFAWLSTKQIGQRFRLAEDYAFKASISRAYEGFRREAARFDQDMEAKLLGSALARLDELPLRLVEEKSHGSPWHELASSDVVKRAMKQIPGFAGQIKDLAEKAIGMAASSKVRRERTPPGSKAADE